MHPLARLLVIVAAATYLPMIAIHALCIFGSAWSIPGVVDLLLLVPTFAIFALLSAPARLPWRSQRASALQDIAFYGGLVVLIVPTAWASAALRRFGFELAARRAEPVVHASESFAHERGQPPQSLHDLVPRYLPAIPDRLPPLTIEAGSDVERHYAGNRWVLTASVSTGLVNFDRFLYFPNGAYPQQGYGGWLERIGTWAYVHE